MIVTIRGQGGWHWRRAAGLALIILTLPAGPAPAQETAAPGFAGAPVFEMPRLTEALSGALLRLRAGDVAGAGATLEALVERYPEAWSLQTARAVAAALAGEPDRAAAALLEAYRLGAPGLGTALGRPPLAALADDPRLAGLRDRPKPDPAPLPDPALVKAGQAPVGPGNTGWDPTAARLVARFSFPPILKTHAFLDRPPPGPLADLQQLVARGFAAGNVGDLYDNRDGGHSRLPIGRREQLAHVVYSAEARAAGIHYGLNTQILFEAPTFGNSSTAISGSVWRSQPRLALTSPGGAARLWQLYSSNHLYVFPEHADHDPPAEGGRGDLLPANTPYVLISQGSSSSDRPHLQAIRAILAAFARDTKARLIEERLIAPMLQQVFRRGQKAIAGDPAAYMSGRAHPSAFRGEDIDLATMIRLAQALRPETIPPMVRLALRRESKPGPVFADRLGERLFDTPGAIARVWRGAAAIRVYEIEAQAKDPNGRKLGFHWRILRGDPGRIRIEPLDETGARVRVTLGWHEPSPVPGRPEIPSARVDIAVFADNGAELSAPAFFSMLYPAHQDRRFDAGRLSAIDHRADRKTYVDPLIWPRRDWQDRFLRNAEGRTIGWTRQGPVGPARFFTAHGLEVLETGPDGRPARARRVTYPVSRDRSGGLQVTETPAEARFRYRYAGPDDRIGKPVPE